MELKWYQKNVIDNLKRYLELVNISNNYAQAYRDLMEENAIRVGAGGVPDYRDTVPSTPHVCFKVPTGGGKTFLACNSIQPIFDSMNSQKVKVVVWLVPSDSILEQTAKALSDCRHPYRQKLDIDFSGRVEVITKQMALNGQNFNPVSVRENLTILVMSYDSFRSSNKEGRKVYQENSALVQFAKIYGNGQSSIANCDETALAQVLNLLSPLVIVDESHHATSTLSVDVLKNLNPCFILDLTATPKSNSNIIAYVDAIKLKKANMVKLPVILYNRKNQNDVIRDAIDLRNNLENIATAERNANEGKYIRPIVLFQAQPRTDDDNTTFEKIKKILINDVGIPENQIAIKTSKVNELKNVDLMSEGCQIRYIITVNALKEGWDCPFAYILATVASRSSAIDVEQILGRILRQPYTEKRDSSVLNMSYVLTCSEKFRETVDKVIVGLNSAGFSKRDVRTNVEEATLVETTSEGSKQVQLSVSESENNNDDDWLNAIDFSVIKDELSSNNGNVCTDMIMYAENQQNDYNSTLGNDVETDYGFASSELRDKMNLFYVHAEFKPEIESLKIPQFFIKSESTIFTEEEYQLLTKEHLCDGFTLRDKDSEIDFSNIDELVKIDILGENDSAPKYMKLNDKEAKVFKQYFNSLSVQGKIDNCVHNLFKQLRKDNLLDDNDLIDYLKRIVTRMDGDMLSDLNSNTNSYASKIKSKINKLRNEYAKKQFKELLDKGEIVCKPNYVFPEYITPLDCKDSLPKSLYTAEPDVNEFEETVISTVASLDNVRWWHKVKESAKGEFFINGYVETYPNHYPDFLVMTNKGMLIALETKGDHLVGEVEKSKVFLGRAWQNAAGNDQFRYFMVYQHRDVNLDGAYYFDNFMGIIKKL